VFDVDASLWQVHGCARLRHDLVGRRLRAGGSGRSPARTFGPVQPRGQNVAGGRSGAERPIGQAEAPARTLRDEFPKKM
jgi:hypothetical protein